MDRLVQDGIELNRAYQYKFCSPTRCSLQVLCNARHRAGNARETAHRVSWIVHGRVGILVVDMHR
jgi:arylsulfatase A-like enzyme